jgi:preprotein translocase subunit SecE
MGKVKDGPPASKAVKPVKGGALYESRRHLVSFSSNLLLSRTYKPLQGWNARLYTAVGLGFVAALGIYRLHETLQPYGPGVRFGIPSALGLALAWILYRTVQYPPFADFLIATEAELNKVSWTTTEDLKRSTAVVLSTVLLMSFFLFGVDWLWSSLLQLIGVLRFDGGGGFGSNA